MKTKNQVSHFQIQLALWSIDYKILSDDCHCG